MHRRPDACFCRFNQQKFQLAREHDLLTIGIAIPLALNFIASGECIYGVHAMTACSGSNSPSASLAM